MRIWIIGALPLIFSATLFAAARVDFSPKLVREAAIPVLQASPVACGGLPYTITLVILDDGVPLDQVDLVTAIDNRVGQMDDDNAIIDKIRDPALQPDGR